MSLIKWEPFNELDKLSLFDDRFFQTFPRLGTDLSVDVYEEDGKVKAKMSLPGIKPEEVDISVEDNLLTITGKREEEEEIKKKDYYSKEIRRGSFTRTVRLPKNVQAEKAEATYEDGMLLVALPVAEGSKEKTVHVKVKK